MSDTNNVASFTYPIAAGNIKKGSHVILKGVPCKVDDISISKTGNTVMQKLISKGLVSSPRKSMKI